jgi:prolipoprotein diacylglyceryltransferase
MGNQSLDRKQSICQWPDALPSWTFRAVGAGGLTLAILLTMVSAALCGLSPRIMTIAALATIAGFWSSATIEKVITGEEKLVCYRQKLTALASAALILRLLNEPIVPYLDLVILGAGTLLASGRIGCLLVGCCHGRPSRWGIRYGQSHAERGFPSHYVGVRLFPIQAVESFFVFCLVIIGIALVSKGSAAGAVLSFYIAAYAVGRFFLEFARGDAERPFLWNFSEAQWTSVLLIWALVFAEHRRMLPASEWHRLAAIGLIFCVGMITVKRRLEGNHRFQLRHPHHMREVAQAMRQISDVSVNGDMTESVANTSMRSPVIATSRGIQLSGGSLRDSVQSVRHYCFSRRGTALTPDEADILAHTVALLDHLRVPTQLLQGRTGIFHLLCLAIPVRGRAADPGSSLSGSVEMMPRSGP